MADAIRTLVVRGAPAIGVAAAFGVALAARQSPARDGRALLADLEVAIAGLGRPRGPPRSTSSGRSTGCGAYARGARDAAARPSSARGCSRRRRPSSRRTSPPTGALGAHGAALVPAGARILTHCNAGALATAGYGTALGIVRAAHAQGKARAACGWTRRGRCMQGSRLTAWELAREGIPHRLIADVAAASVMARGEVDLVVTGRRPHRAPTATPPTRSARTRWRCWRGTTASRSTWPRPFSTIDAAIADGAAIPSRSAIAARCAGVAGRQTAPAASPVFNPAFDVTPAELITAIVTERGVFRAAVPLQREPLHLGAE